MIIKKVFSIISLSAPGVLMWYIARWEKNDAPWPFDCFNATKEFYVEILYDDRIKMGFFCWLGFTILGIYLAHRKKPKVFIKSMLANINSAAFSGFNGIQRITIYRAERGIIKPFLYMWNSLIRNCMPHVKKGVWWHHFKSIPCIGKKYLYFYTRKGIPYEEGTSTYFKIPRASGEVQNIATNCLVAQGDYCNDCPMPNLTNIDLTTHKDVSKITPTKNRKTVQRYMKESMTHNFKKLKSFHWLPTNVYTASLFNSKNKLWGIIVFDNMGDTSYNQAKSEMAFYIKNIATTIKEVDQC